MRPPTKDSSVIRMAIAHFAEMSSQIRERSQSTTITKQIELEGFCVQLVI